MPCDPNLVSSAFYKNRYIPFLNCNFFHLLVHIIHVHEPEQLWFLKVIGDVCIYMFSQAHRETLQLLVERMYSLFSSRFVQEQESDSLRKTLDHCIKLLHKCCEFLCVGAVSLHVQYM